VGQIVIGSCLLIGGATMIGFKIAGSDMTATATIAMAGPLLAGGLFLTLQLRIWYLLGMALIAFLATLVVEFCSLEDDAKRWDWIIGVSVALGVLLAMVAWYFSDSHEIIRSFMRAKAGDLDGAVSLTRAFLKRKGPDRNAYGNLINLLAAQGKWAEVVIAAEEAEQSPIEKPEKLGLFKAIALVELERWAEALPYLDEAMQAEPENMGLICHFGAVMAGLGRIAEARERLKLAESLLERKAQLSSEADLLQMRQAIDHLRAAIARFEVAITPAPPG
jgi:tetratricopeptide (TPR) repeat protein